jgi:hypothetical protein
VRGRGVGIDVTEIDGSQHPWSVRPGWSSGCSGAASCCCRPVPARPDGAAGPGRGVRSALLAIEDALEAHQRPELERYGDTPFVVLRAARYIDAAEEVDFGGLHVFVGPDFVITVRHGAAPDLAAVRARMEDSPDLLARVGPAAGMFTVVPFMLRPGTSCMRDCPCSTVLSGS